MPYKPAMREWCEGWENDGAIGIIFPSEEDFKDSEYYDGRDQVKGDPVASYAVWPGKNNVGRTPSDWWRCAVVHPFCSHGWEMIDPNQLELDEDFKDFGTELLAEQAEENKKYRENRDKNRNKSHFYDNGIYRECNCSHPDYTGADYTGETGLNPESWVKEYLRNGTI